MHLEQRTVHAAVRENPSTVVSGLRVPVGIGDYSILEVVRSSDGSALTATDDELLEGMRPGMTEEGISTSPESGAAIFAARMLRHRGYL